MKFLVGFHLFIITTKESLLHEGRRRFCYMKMILKDKSGVGMINATKQTYHLQSRILTFVSHSEP